MTKKYGLTRFAVEDIIDANDDYFVVVNKINKAFDTPGLSKEKRQKRVNEIRNKFSARRAQAVIDYIRNYNVG